MDWATILGSVSGGVVGFVGAIGQQVFTVWQKGKEHKMRMEELEVMSRVNLQQADLNLRATQEDHAGSAFTAAITAQAALTGSSPLVRDIIALFRPGLTALLVISAVIQALYVGGESAAFFGMSIHNLAAITVGYWFGVRQFEKVAVTPAFTAKK